MPFFKILIVNILFLTCVKAGVNESQLHVIVSGESHGMVEGCDCIHDPGGGLARRATILNSLDDRGNLLLLDAGGFSAGDMYDSYTEGRNADSVRTLAMIKGMGMLKYDAVAIGDDDLQYGGKWLVDNAIQSSLAIVSANCFYKNGSSLVKPFVVVKKGKLTIGITAVASNEQMITTDSMVEIRDPVSSIAQIWNKMKKNTDIQIIISHCGDELYDTLTSKFPDCDLIINGHRKKGTDPLYFTEKIPEMQFGFQGKSLSDALFTVDSSVLKLNKSTWIKVSQNIAEDTVMSNRIRYTFPPRKDVYDLYIMSQCPYGIEALGEFLEFRKTFPAIQWEIRFIGSVDKNGELSSLHGNNEVADEMKWLAIKALYPEKWIEFLSYRAKATLPSYSIPSDLHIDEKLINGWIEKHGKSILAGHYIRSNRLSINGSPTLLKNNVPIEQQITKKRLSREYCKSMNGHFAYCDSLPVCIDDSDCRMKGKIGRCISDTCEFRDAVHFPFTVLVNDSLHEHPEDQVIETTEELFPGAEISKISIHSDKGKMLLQKWKTPPLPFYVFGNEVSLTHNYSSIESGLVPFDNGFTFKNGIMRQNYFPGRNELSGEITAFIDPFSDNVNMLLDTLCVYAGIRQFSIKPIVYKKPETVEPGTIDMFRQEEAIRWLVIEKIFKSKFVAYIKSYAKHPGSSFWNSSTRNAEINIDSLTSIAEKEGRQYLLENYKTLENLDLKDPCAILKNNRELVVIKTAEDVRKIIGVGNTH